MKCVQQQYMCPIQCIWLCIQIGLDKNVQRLKLWVAADAKRQLVTLGVETVNNAVG
jgi:hypothetical protein